MASEAPKAAAEDTPSVNGLASGLLRMVCISAPAAERGANQRGHQGLRQTDVPDDDAGAGIGGALSARHLLRQGGRPRREVSQQCDENRRQQQGDEPCPAAQDVPIGGDRGRGCRHYCSSWRRLVPAAGALG